jgi:PAS domain S-box-containing protein
MRDRGSKTPRREATKGESGAGAQPLPEPGVRGFRKPAPAVRSAGELQRDLPEGIPPEMFTGAGMLALADLLPVMVAYLDRDLTYRFVNKAYADWFERPRTSIMGKTVHEHLGDHAYAERENLLAGALAGERQWFASSFDHPLRGPVALHIDYVPWPGADGTAQGVLVLLSDVTEQRTAERALRESEARFRRIADSAPVMMWVTRRDGTRDFVNEAYADFACGEGCDREEARALDWTEFLHPEDRDSVLGLRPLYESGQPVAFEARFRRHDGEYRWLRSVSQPRFGADGTLVGYIGVATDITVRKEAELELRHLVEERTSELRDSEARFRAVFETVLELLILMKPDGTVIEMNNPEVGWRAANSRDVIGKKIWDGPTLKLFSEYREPMRRAIAAAAKGEQFAQQIALERPGMATTYLDVTVQPVKNAAGKVTYLLFEARDITELRSAQEQLRQSQKMEALGQLTGGIAHDFNNLLTVVVGGLDLVAKRIEDPKLKRYATNALAAAERGARLTGQLLAFSRVQRLEVRPVHVAPLIEQMRPLLRNVLGPGITKTFNLDEAMVPVMADPTQLEVAVLNLAINARDAMPDGGQLHFATTTMWIEGDPEIEDGDYIELTISDTGSGMTEDVASRAFEPFFTTKEVGKGTGLGLSMVYGMARQSGGTARIETAPGRGTAVKLYFKAAGEIAHTAGAEGQDDPVGQKLEPASVLVVDDDPDVRGFIAEALADTSYRVRDCADGRSALKLFAEERPDLVVLDYVMPEMSGAEVAERILADCPEQKILFVSGYSETEAIRKIASDAPLLPKPFRADALARAVQKALAK